MSLKIEVTNGGSKPLVALAVDVSVLGTPGVLRALVDLLAAVGGQGGTPAEPGWRGEPRGSTPYPAWIDTLTPGQRELLRAIEVPGDAASGHLRRRLGLQSRSMAGMLGGLARRFKRQGVPAPFHVEQDENGDRRYIWTGWRP